MYRYLFILFVLCASCQQQPIDTTAEEAAIKKLLEKESATWRAGDLKAHAECWQLRTYSKILVSTPDGNTYDVPPQDIINPKPEMMDNGGTSTNTNYKFSINGDHAWVSHDEMSVAPDGKKNYSYEIRMLEKVNGEWKLVGQSIHLYDPTKKNKIDHHE